MKRILLLVLYSLLITGCRVTYYGIENNCDNDVHAIFYYDPFYDYPSNENPVDVLLKFVDSNEIEKIDFDSINNASTYKIPPREALIYAFEEDSIVYVNFGKLIIANGSDSIEYSSISEIKTNSSVRLKKVYVYEIDESKF